MIYYGKQNISEEDIKAVADVLRSELITQGPVVEKFEKAIAEYCGAKYAVACANGTAALHIACLSLGIGKGDIVYTSPNTFVASANCALFCGASVDFVDIDIETYNMDVFKLEEKLIEAKKNNKIPKAVIPVHFAGQSCEMDKIYSLSKEYGFFILEDACHALGGKFNNKPVGSCEFSDAAVFSFHPVKMITTGEGGMVLTNKKEIYEKLKLLRTHGIIKEPEFMTKEPDGTWYYEMIDLGFNYRITDFQAALGLSQLKRLNDFIKKRNEIAENYNKQLKDLPVKTPKVNNNTLSAFHLYVVQINLEAINNNKNKFFLAVREKGVELHVHYIPVHLQPYYTKLGFKKGDFLVSENYYECAITLPLYVDLSESDQEKVVHSLKNVLK
ncbi:MAG: UDP-4-amino-4,6-dideoxy-N-acetyl-beta-L-altrosamine transaminase [Spirochaetia bacterium]|nr:UDP-4-amino-4,6-dideoxy-N-acetyl-beta-L-altrosamine transaminase [Spirochaetia bacterium]